MAISRVVSFLGGLDVELLVAAGLVSSVHSSGVDLGGFGLAPAFRAGRQKATIDFHEWSEGTLLAALEAAARGVPSMPTTTAPDSAVVAANPWLAVAPDPISGVPVTFAKALAVDVALIHVPAVDAAGNAHIEGDVGIDGVIARGASTTIVTADASTSAPARDAAISRLWIDGITVVEGASWPTACHPHALVDLPALAAWAASPGDDISLLEPAR